MFENHSKEMVTSFKVFGRKHRRAGRFGTQ